ncbi:MAG: formate dehydrogenase accessory sulfurtransferase FdhD [Anaerolineaceae bacterium]
MSNQRSKPIKYYRVEAGKPQLNETLVSIEREVALIVNGKAWMDLLCTPSHLDCLAAGFLFNEGLIHAQEDLTSLNVCQGGEYVELTTAQALAQPRYFHRTTGCSGGMTSLNLPEMPAPRLQDIHLAPAAVTQLLQQFLEAEKATVETRGVHCSALSDGQEILAIMDDIGRHNTLDKLAGYCLLNLVSLPQPVVLTTGRISSEMLQKSAHLGASVIISLNSPNDYAISLARSWGITLVGYARSNGFNLYTHPARIVGADLPDPLDGSFAD